MIIVKSFSESCRKEWDVFALGSPSSSLFHLTGWKDAVETVFGHKPHYIMAERDGKITGILPLFEVKSRLFGHALTSVPFGVYGGISAQDAESHRVLERSARILAEAIGVNYLELRDVDSPGATEEANGAEEIPAGMNKDGWISKGLYVTFKKPILETVDTNFEAIPRKQRRMIRQGMKLDLTSRVGRLEDLEEFYRIYARNVRDLGSPVFPISFFRTLMKNFGDSFILSVWKGGEMVAGVLTFIYKDTLMPYYGGGLREYFEFAINDFMYWELLKWGCENGYRVFDFGRSKKDTGSYHFKRHWGFEPAELDYRYYLVRSKEMPNVSPVNPKYRLFVNLWKRLPFPVANWLGPKLVRGIP
ncbi:MAG: FemAB family PEP-CTERM system-associated protein [Deltaproteobacteria bacterium]|nr:FemAB family PEP-CTERM system-associated protein [Deltaproteobacteria bacterium]